MGATIGVEHANIRWVATINSVAVGLLSHTAAYKRTAKPITNNVWHKYNKTGTPLITKRTRRLGNKYHSADAQGIGIYNAKAAYNRRRTGSGG